MSLGFFKVQVNFNAKVHVPTKFLFFFNFFKKFWYVDPTQRQPCGHVGLSGSGLFHINYSIFPWMNISYGHVPVCIATPNAVLGGQETGYSRSYSLSLADT